MTSFQFKDNSKKISKALLEAAERGVKKASEQVESSAKALAPVGQPNGGHLRNDSIKYEIETHAAEIVSSIGSTSHYAPHVEFGTGEFAENGKGRKGYWVFVDDGSEGGPRTTSKRYSLQEAKQIMAIMRSKGLKAFYTNGQEPQPFLRPAFEDNQAVIPEIIGYEIDKAVGR